MAVNGSELINAPWDTIMSPFTALLGNGFYLIPVTFIAIALYVKTRDAVLASMWVLAAGILMATASIFTGYMEMSILYTVIAAAGITGIVMSILYMRK